MKPNVTILLKLLFGLAVLIFSGLFYHTQNKQSSISRHLIRDEVRNVEELLQNELMKQKHRGDTKRYLVKVENGTNARTTKAEINHEKLKQDVYSTVAPPTDDYSDIIYQTFKPDYKSKLYLGPARGSVYPNPHDFQYILNNASLCQGNKRVRYVVYVHSSPQHFTHRSSLRTTWARRNLSPRYESRLVFLLGTVEDIKLQEELVIESRLHGDLVQEGFHDSYRNLTFKGIAAIKFLTLNCPQVDWVIKTDDDTYVNILFLLEILERLQREKKKRFFLGIVWKGMPILRNPKTCSKWCVDERLLPKAEVYPVYCSGASWVMSGDILPEMYAASLQTPFFWVDDVYISGLLPRKIPNITYISLTGRYAHFFHKYNFMENLKNNTLKNRQLLTMTSNPNDMKKLWLQNLSSASPVQQAMLGLQRYKQLINESISSIFSPK